MFVSPSKNLSLWIAAGLLGLLAWSPLRAQQAPPAEGTEAELIAVLESDAPLFDKAKACQQLAVIGTEKAVPALAKLLADEKLSHYARFGLEPNPDPSVDAALRAALNQLDGGLLVGVINSIGMRRDAGAVDALKGLMGNSDPAVAAAAAAALGRIATPESIATLREALAGPQPLRSAAADACLTAADILIAAGSRSEAAALCDGLRKADLPKHLQLAALHGAIRARGTDALPLLAECLDSDDPALFRVGLRMAHEIGGPEVAKALIEAIDLPKASEAKENEIVIKKAEYGVGDRRVDVTEQVIAAVRSGSPIEASNRLAGDPAPGVVKELRIVYAQGGQEHTVIVPEGEQLSLEGRMEQHPRQVVLIHALADLAQPAALPFILEAAKSGAWDIRQAAIRVLGTLGDATAIPVLLSAAVGASGLAQTALDSLVELEGAGVDAALIQALEGARGDERIVLIRLMGLRGIAGAVPVLKQAAGDEDPEVAAAAMRSLGTTIGLDDLGFLLERLVKPRSSEEGAAAKDALAKAVLRMPDRDACAAKLLDTLAAAPATAKADLFDLLGALGGEKALLGVAAAAKRGSEDEQDAATRVLGNWMSPDAAPVLLELAKTGSPKFRVRSLRGYIRIVRQFGLPNDQRLAMCRQAMEAATRDQEKRLVLDALTRVPTRAALEMAVAHLDDPGLKEAACAAAVAIAEKVFGAHPAAVADAMQKVAQTTTNAELAGRAKALAGRAKRKLRKR